MLRKFLEIEQPNTDLVELMVAYGGRAASYNEIPISISMSISFVLFIASYYEPVRLNRK
jgi:hypothetical protein